MPELDLALSRCTYLLTLFTCGCLVYLVTSLVRRMDLVFTRLAEAVPTAEVQNKLDTIERGISSDRLKRLLRPEDAAAVREVLPRKHDV